MAGEEAEEPLKALSNPTIFVMAVFPLFNGQKKKLETPAWPPGLPRPGSSAGAGAQRPAGTPELPYRAGPPGSAGTARNPGTPAEPAQLLTSGPAEGGVEGAGPPAPVGAAIARLLPYRAPPSCAVPVQRGRRHLVPSPRGVPAMAGLPCRLLLLCLAAAAASADLVLEEVRRSLDLSTHLAKISAELSLANAPGGAAASTFLLALEPGLEPRLAHLGVQVSEGSGHRAPRPGARGRCPAPRPQGHVGTAGSSAPLPDPAAGREWGCVWRGEGRGGRPGGHEGAIHTDRLGTGRCQHGRSRAGSPRGRGHGPYPQEGRRSSRTIFLS